MLYIYSNSIIQKFGVSKIFEFWKKLILLLSKKALSWSNDAFRLGTVRLGSARLSTARFVFPLQFSTALERAGLFICHYSCAASTTVTPEKLFHSASLHQALAGSAPLLSTREMSVLPSTDNEKAIFWLLKKRCAHSKQLRSILRWLCWFKSSRFAVSRVASLMTQAVTIFSGQSVISRVYTSRFGNGTVRLEPHPRWYWKKYQVPGTVPSGKLPKSEPYCAVPCSGKAP